MLFGEDYDRSLWLILVSDKDNRDRIVDFINSIPREMFNQIYEQLFLIQSYEKNNVSFDLRDEKLFLQANRFIKDDLVYQFILDPYTYELTLSCFKVNDEEHDYIFQLTLCPLNTDYYTLGMIQYDSKDRNIVHTVDYQINNTLLGIKVNKIYDYSYIRTKLVNFSRKYPGSVSLEDFKDNDRLNSLIKSRKRGKNK